MTTEKPISKLEAFVSKLSLIEDETKTKLKKAMDQSEKDVEISDDLDVESMKTGKILAKYLRLYTNESLVLKDLFTLKEKTKLERWKFYSGKQTEKYMIENGILHEKILKMDIDKYLASDEKMIAVNHIINIQKALVDYYEKITKELSSSRNFQIKAAIEWRKFVSGVV